jgi:RNA-directed DNA polymerase
MGRVRRRIGDKRVLSLVKAFLKVGILTEDRQLEDTTAGTPQGGILSPLLANVALSALDEHIARMPGGSHTGKRERERRLRHSRPNLRLVRYADDWCLMVKGSKTDAEALREEIAEVLSTLGLRLSPEKTLITHIDEGLDFLGWHIQRHRKRGTSQHYVYVYPSKKAVQAVKAKIKTLCREQVAVSQPLDDLLRRLNAMVRGWCGYFRHGVASATFHYLSHYLWQRVWGWLRRKYHRAGWKQLRRRYCGGRWWPATEHRTLINPAEIRTIWYRYRGSVIPTPWPDTNASTTSPARLAESPVH